MSRVLVVGAGGFIGAHVVRSFLRRGWEVVAGTRSVKNARLEVDHPLLTFQAIDLLDTAHAGLECRADLLVNCAGYGVNPRENNPAVAIKVNAVAVADLIVRGAAAGIRHMIHLGSAVEYDPHPEPISEDMATVRVDDQLGTYAGSKLAGSILAFQAARAAGVALCVVRPFGCYGAFESPEKFIPGLLAALRDNCSIDLSSGAQVRDYTFVDDVADAIVALAVCHASGVVNICSGVPITIRALGEALIRVVGADPALARWGARASRPGEVDTLVGNPGRLQRLTGWNPKTGIEQGLSMTVAGQCGAQAIPGHGLEAASADSGA